MLNKLHVLKGGWLNNDKKHPCPFFLFCFPFFLSVPEIKKVPWPIDVSKRGFCKKAACSLHLDRTTFAKNRCNRLEALPNPSFLVTTPGKREMLHQDSEHVVTPQHPAPTTLVAARWGVLRDCCPWDRPGLTMAE